VAFAFGDQLAVASHTRKSRCSGPAVPPPATDRV